jgi:hypothetical protein
MQRVLKVPVQHVQHGMTKPPNEKQGGDHEKRKQKRAAVWLHLGFSGGQDWLIASVD